MVKSFRPKQLMRKLFKLRDCLHKESSYKVIEVRDQNIDSSRLDDTEFEYFYPHNVLVKIPRQIVDQLTGKEINDLLREITGRQIMEKRTNKGESHERQKVENCQRHKTNTAKHAVCVVTEKTKRPSYKRAKSRPESFEPVACSSSESESDEKPCTVRQRREGGKTLDIVHGTVCYSQCGVRDGRKRTHAEVVTEFLNTITNDIVDINKEPIPKDPECLPALGAAGMYPTKKWLADLKHRGVKPESNKTYKELRARTRSGRTSINHLVGAETIYPWRNPQRNFSEKATKRRHAKRHRSVRSMTDGMDSFSDL